MLLHCPRKPRQVMPMLLAFTPQALPKKINPKDWQSKKNISKTFFVKD